MTFHEAMREATRRADEAKAHSEDDSYGSKYARATGALIVHLANEPHDHARTKAELERHQAFIRTQ